jgi:hypothetical protein
MMVGGGVEVDSIQILNFDTYLSVVMVGCISMSQRDVIVGTIKYLGACTAIPAKAKASERGGTVKVVPLACPKCSLFRCCWCMSTSVGTSICRQYTHVIGSVRGSTGISMRVAEGK